MNRARFGALICVFLVSFCFTDAVTFVTRESVWEALRWKWMCLSDVRLRSNICERVVKRLVVPLADSIAVNAVAYSGILEAAQVHHRPQTATKASNMAHLRFKQDMQCTYNVTLRRVLVTIVVLKKQLVLRILSVCL
jgi:hypothetical protein